MRRLRSKRIMISLRCRRSCANLRSVRWIVFLCLLLFGTGMAWAHWTPDIRVHRPVAGHRFTDASLSSWSVCLQEAASMSGVDPALWQAIVGVESGEHPYAFGWFDRTGARRSYKATTYRDAVSHFDRLERQQIRFDVGLAQVNSRNLKALQPRTGISPVRALDPCTNLRMAAMVLREQIHIHGPTWKAVAGYNGAATYAPKVYRAYCTRVPDDAACQAARPLSQLLCEPIPVSRTAQYYRVFSRPL
jgi:hypothetical protein